MASDNDIDVIVIGGGPGGATAATMLARKGLRVLLLERERFPREHVGESLLPASIPVLEELGVLPAIQSAGFVPKRGATMVWGKEASPWSWYFSETNQKYPHSYQVWRPTFDQILLENCKANGVDVREGCNVSEVLLDESRASGVRYIAEGGSEHTVNARFIVDASGQAGLIGRKMGLRQWDDFFRNMAVYAYFKDAQRLPQPDETNIFIESYTHGWFWNIPLNPNLASVGVVVDSQTGQEGINKIGLQKFFTDQIKQSPHTSAMLSHAKMVSGPLVIKDWSYVTKGMAGDGYVLVGDAACFVDPLFSSGVHLALMSGVMAAAYVVTALKDEAMREPAGRVYEELYLKEYSHFRELARLFYASNRTSDSYFWEARRILEAGDDDSPRQAFIRAVAGQPPRGYERAVLSQGEIPTEFATSVLQVEAERTQRRANLEAQADTLGAAFVDTTPHLAQGVSIERKPVLAEGEFVWSYVITTASQPEGTPCSGLVAKLVSLVDGRTSVAGLMAKLCEGLNENLHVQVQSSVAAALQILYVDGAIDEL